MGARPSLSILSGISIRKISEANSSNEMKIPVKQFQGKPLSFMFLGEQDVSNFHLFKNPVPDIFGGPCINGSNADSLQQFNG
jgi:hypothetical protein